MLAVLLLYIVFLFFIEVVLGSSADTYYAEIGYEGGCKSFTQLPKKQFFTQLLPIILFFALFPFLLSELL